MSKFIEDFSLIKKKNNETIGLCHGVFDLIHLGHINHFKEAKKKCDILVVSITADKFIKKGPHQPYFSHFDRANFLSELKPIDFVIISNQSTAEKVLNKIKPNFYIKGIDYLNLKNDKNLKLEKIACKKNKIKIIYTNSIKLSSTKILNNKFNLFSDRELKFLKALKKKYKLEKILSIINSLSTKDVNITGEPIIDSYTFVDVIGTATKSPIITSDFKYKEEHYGGSILVARFAAEFSNKVNFLIPSKKIKLNQLNKIFPKNVNVKLFDSMDKIPVKNRYIAHVKKNKLFQVNFLEEKISMKSKSFVKILNKLSKKNPLLLIDFGLNMFSKNDKKNLNVSNIYLNTQANSNNYGFNLFTNYKTNMKYLSINQRELELVVKTKSNNLDILSKEAIKNKRLPISVTLGVKGSIFINKKRKVFYCPNFFPNALDTIGCGDAYYTISSLLINQGYDDEIVPFVGNIYAGLHSRIFGNSNIPSKKDLVNSIKSFYNF
ncbi:adenylyltransferase/cytidyltransferase family protein [Candidatus Pelagibacter sp.]|nr:adenylyltransferase/cytidyltransferase family protein [Candidatus Pelagibacter sp.]